jgi:hypothetical protein
LALLLLALACGQDHGDEDRLAPPAPRMRLKSCAPTDAPLPETGVDADATSGAGIRLEWDMVEEPDDLAGFVIYRTLDPDSSYQPLDVDPGRFLEGHPDWYSHVDLDPALRAVALWGPRAWYFVRALDESGNASAPSDTVTYRLWAAPRLLPGQVQARNDSLLVSWQYEFVDYFALGFRGFQILATNASGDLAWSGEVLLNLEPQMSAAWSRAELGLDPGTYRLRVDTVIAAVPQVDSLHVAVSSNPSGCALAGSESNWISFTF